MQNFTFTAPNSRVQLAVAVLGFKFSAFPQAQGCSPFPRPKTLLVECQKGIAQSAELFTHLDLITLVQVDVLQTLQCQGLILHRAPTPSALPLVPPDAAVPLVGLLHLLLHKDKGLVAFKAFFGRLLGLSPLRGRQLFRRRRGREPLGEQRVRVRGQRDDGRRLVGLVGARRRTWVGLVDAAGRWTCGGLGRFDIILVLWRRRIFAADLLLPVLVIRPFLVLRPVPDRVEREVVLGVGRISCGRGRAKVTIINVRSAVLLAWIIFRLGNLYVRFGDFYVDYVHQLCREN